MFEYNKNAKERDKFLFGDGGKTERYKLGGICRIPRMAAADIKYLLEEKYADPEERQNFSPTIKEFYDFLVSHPDFYAFGYAVSPQREDYRISIEGVRCDKDIKVSELIDFVHFAKDADESGFDTSANSYYAWWD